MDLHLTEKEIIYILNCISIALNFMKWHTYEEKERIKMYFDYSNYFDNYYDIQLIHRSISCSANKHFYNIRDSVFFKGQEDFMAYKNFKFLKDEERYYNNLIKFIDKNKNVV